MMGLLVRTVKSSIRNQATYLRFFMDSNIKPEYSTQIQFQMACTGRKWCDFVSYDPHFTRQSSHLRMRIKRVHPNKKQNEKINKAVETFLAEIEEKVKQILVKAA
ncbi:hypothetical protein O9A_00192 [Bartonella koehlerae C-29]|uniref:Uncharacterized protein n=1 Tax=Bartonella koehlerae C-29 TaxID=1134510 RepID=A0A067WJ73_9HYPH|nr:hypothetical protein O9A_00192 [Bartonella koehlerae C-29]